MVYSETKICQNCRNSFVIDASDFDFFKKIQAPPPTWCPKCRFQRRLVFMNDRDLYKRICDMCGKNIITMYPPEADVTVYCNPCWWSDKWDGGEYERDYDPSTPFLEQLKELDKSTPQYALELSYPTLINSDYINHAATAKNCYLIFFADECENVLYSEYMLHNKDSMDGTMYSFCELCYGTIVSGKCFRAFFSEDCESCYDIYFCKDCTGCSNCFGCIGLRNKQYHIWNDPYSKEEYEKKIKEFGIDSYQNLIKHKKQAREFWLTYPHKFAHMQRNLNVTGEYVYESKNSKDLYAVAQGAEDSRYCQLLSMSGVKDAYDYCMWGNGAQLIYEAMICGEGASNVKFSFDAWANVRDIEYCMKVITCSNMFGCANIRNKQYCILNKQYSQEEYHALRKKIIRDMTERPYRDRIGRVYPYGEFLPPDLSLFAYNQTYAMSFFPLAREEAERHGFSWYDAKPSSYVPTLEPEDIPDSISAVEDSMVNEIIECASCKKVFRIVKAELDLLRFLGLPVPRQCPNCRFKERWGRINKPKLYHRKCQCAGLRSENDVYENTRPHFHKKEHCVNEFETAYAPNRKEIIYCKRCHSTEVV